MKGAATRSHPELLCLPNASDLHIEDPEEESLALAQPSDSECVSSRSSEGRVKLDGHSDESADENIRLDTALDPKLGLAISRALDAKRSCGEAHCKDSDDSASNLACVESDSDGFEPSDPLSTQLWRPGWSLGNLFPRVRPLVEQSQVLVVNTLLAIRRWPIRLRSAVRDFVVKEGKRERRTMPSLLIAAGLLRLSPSRIWRTFTQLRADGWTPQSSVPEQRREAADPADRTKPVLRTLVRAALGARSSHAPHRFFQEALCRLSLEGVDVGNKYHTKDFFADVVFLSARCMQAFDAADVHTPLGGLGIRSDFAALFDGVPIGGVVLYGRHGTMVVVCLNSVSASDHRLHSRLVASFVSSTGHGGEATARNVVDALAAEPFCLTIRELERSLSLVGGDGAVVQGGREGRAGTRAAEIMWEMVHTCARTMAERPIPVARPDLIKGSRPHIPGEEDDLINLLPSKPDRDRHVRDDSLLLRCTEWDKFHRDDLAVARAIQSSPMAQEMYDICRLMDTLFNLGEGGLLLRTAADIVGDVPQRAVMPGLARKVGSLAREPGVILHNFRTYAAAMHTRLLVGEEQRQTKSKRALVEAGRRLTCLDFVAFTALYRDVGEKHVLPWALAIQSNALEPWVLASRWRRHQATSQDMRSLMYWSRGLLRLLMLLRQHCTPEEASNLTRAMFYACPSRVFKSAAGVNAIWGRVLPTFVIALVGFLAESGPHFQGAGLTVYPPLGNSGKTCLGPHCTCSFLPGRQKKISMTPGAARPLLTSMKAWRRAPLAHFTGPLRFHFAAQLTLPLGTKEKKRFFRDRIREVPGDEGGRLSRCQMPTLFPQTVRDIDEAIVAATSFVTKLDAEEQRMFNEVGVNAGMKKLQAGMSLCFDWERLVHQRPSADDVHAFGEVARLLLPYLRSTQWPSRQAFPGVRHSWPSIPELQVQYVGLLHLVRLAAKKVHRVRSAGWFTLTGYVVEPVETYASVLWFVRAFLRQRTSLLQDLNAAAAQQRSKNERGAYDAGDDDYDDDDDDAMMVKMMSSS